MGRGKSRVKGRLSASGGGAAIVERANVLSHELGERGCSAAALSAGGRSVPIATGCPLAGIGPSPYHAEAPGSTYVL